ncbi:hypothetical protein ACIBUY_39475 [Streptomyces sp. NPDC050085]|uniref:hypothetical protein n=1 Tax=Streptomyces sp. NPDC050085 TaxID=3365600 RepID=UPI0037B93606
MAKPSRPRSRRTSAVLTCTVLAALAVTGGLTAVALNRPDEPRAVTLAEAQRLAMARFTTYETSPEQVTVTLDDGAGSTCVQGLMDHRRHRGVGSYTAGRDGARSGGLIAWDATGLAVAPFAEPRTLDGRGLTRAVQGVPPASWVPRAYTADPLDSVLRVVAALGADRPDNAQLLAQAGPRRLRGETLHGTAYTVFSGPRPRAAAAAAPAVGDSPLTYWVDGKGRLGRVEVAIGSLHRPARIDLAPAPAGARVPGRPWQRQEAAPGSR